MEQQALHTLLAELIKDWENEVVEFKSVGDSYATSEIGKYFSALANEANLRNEEKAWLVFGVDNKTRAVVGSSYRQNQERLQGLKMQIATDAGPSITFRNIHVLETGQGRVLLFEIPSAPLGIPISWKGHYFARAGESLTNLGLDKLDQIRKQVGAADWTAQVVKEATLAHLDGNALKKSREAFAKKYANRFDLDEVMRWSENSFLDRAKLTQDGKITRATLILLDKAESAHL